MIFCLTACYNVHIQSLHSLLFYMYFVQTLSWIRALVILLKLYAVGCNEVHSQIIQNSILGGGQKQSKLFQAMQHFLSQVVMKDMEEVARLFPHEPLTDVYTPKEKDEYNRYNESFYPQRQILDLAEEQYRTTYLLILFQREHASFWSWWVYF